MWESIYEQFPATKQDAPFGNDENKNSLDGNLSDNDNEEYEIENNEPEPSPRNQRKIDTNQNIRPWKIPTTQNHLIIIVNDEKHFDQVKQNIKRDFSRQGFNWSDEEEEIRPWCFGLTSIHVKFIQSKIIDLSILSLASSIPFWLTFKKEKEQNKSDDQRSKKPIRHRLNLNYDVSLRYGALTNVNEFFYAQNHSFGNNDYLNWSFFLNDQSNNNGCIDWIIENSETRLKKQLLISNINHSVIIDSDEDGFSLYICQKCNMNEFKSKSTVNQNYRNNRGNNFSRPRSKHNKENVLKDSDPPPSHRRSSHGPRKAVPIGSTNDAYKSKPLNTEGLHQTNHQSRQQQRATYDPLQRCSEYGGCYFSTVEFSMHYNPLHVRHPQQNIINEIKQKLSTLIEYFLAQRITVCYGKINSKSGPTPYLFFQERLPDFPSLIMKYSWQLLSIVGYRLQIQVYKEKFIEKLFKLSEEQYNPDELFYRVCVYLSRICSLKPFANINDELQHAVNESTRKRTASAYGLVSKIVASDENEAYIPSISLTPTTIRIKPLKLCRTNRVLRATEKFGRSTENFALVDIRDENSSDLQSHHFLHLHDFLLKFLNDGFILMNDNREYKYLHHSQSQLRSRQFWFYHHNNYDKDPSRRNCSFQEAYNWMGEFDKEDNPAKYAARMALCFTTTTATVLIKKSLDIRSDFSCVQFRYNGAKGVVSIDPEMPANTDLVIRDSMEKFKTDHEFFEVCKRSAPRGNFLNQQAILLLSYRKVPDSSFLILQQENHLRLIRALLRNSDAEKIILEKVPTWFLPNDIHMANIDYIHEPFFRHLLINACLQSTRDLLRKARIRVPPNKGRNMFGIVDEYNVLKPDEIFIQYTKIEDGRPRNKTEILEKCKVVITKNPCYHPGDIRTFTAVNHPRLQHLKDVVVFSQQGDRPAPHDISGSDLDGDEYLVVWHEDFVPYNTKNAEPYEYDTKIPEKKFRTLDKRKEATVTILEIAEEDYLGRLSRLHLAFADKFGIDNFTPPAKDTLSTVALAGKISQEVDSGKTGYHPLNDNDIKKLNNALENKRPDFMDKAGFEMYESPNILGK
ncbi:unnamed protein product [Rotaria sp. Silwood1]|nr:unnamed protein product [Rotaria sp. Silwood1]